MSDAAVVIGATGGLGEAVLLRLAAKRPVVIGYHRNKDKAAALLARITAGGGAAWTKRRGEKRVVLVMWCR